MTSVTSTQVTTRTLTPIVEGAVAILQSINCQNVHEIEVPPIVTWEQMKEYFGIENEEGQDDLEAWFIGRNRIRHDPVVRGTFSRYDQHHTLRLTGFAWQQNFNKTYQYMQNKTEELLLTLEKNKGYPATEVLEVSEVATNMKFIRVGEVSLYSSDTTCLLLVSVSESAGRAVT